MVPAAAITVTLPLGAPALSAVTSPVSEMAPPSKPASMLIVLLSAVV
jgi:hypothetical protein